MENKDEVLTGGITAGAAGDAQPVKGAAKFEKDLTRGNVLKQMLIFSLPFLLSNLIQALYNIGDMLIVGLFVGTDSSSIAVNQGGQITILITNIIVGFCLGGTVLIAQYISRKRHEDIKETIGTIFTVLLLAAAVLTILMVALAGTIVRAMGIDAAAQKETIAYVIICMAGNVFVFAYNGISAVLRGMGDSVRPLIIVGCTCALNIGLDILFVGPLGLGVAGAAWATIIAQAIAMFTAVLYLYKKKFIFDFKLRSFRIYPEKLKKLLKVGLPTSVQNAVNSMSFILLIVFINAHGLAAGAGASFASKFNSIAILPIFAIGMAVTAMTAQNIGAGLYKRAIKVMFTGIGISLVVGAVFYILCQCIPDQLVSIFQLKNAGAEGGHESITLGAEYLKTFSIDYIVLAFFVSFAGIINGAGHTMISMGASILSSIVIRVPLAYIIDTVLGVGFTGIAMAMPIATVVTTILCLIYILTGKWKKNKLGTGELQVAELAA